VSDWKTVKLGDVIKLTSGKSKTKKHLHPHSKHYPYPVYGGNGVNGFSNEFLIENDVIVIGRVGEYCGVVHRTQGPSWITDNALYTKELRNKLNIDFTFYLLTYHNLSKLRSRSGQPLVSQKPIYDYEVKLPLVIEQRKIAAILTNVDDAIDKTEAIIEQMGKVKKGLMQRLLTKGIGHTRFKKTEIGEIPEEWEVIKLEDVVEILDGQRKPIKKADRDLIEGEIPYYGASGIIDWVNDYLFNEPLVLVAEDGENLRSRSLPVAFKVEGKTWVNNHAHILRATNININYLEIYLESLNYEAYITGSAQPKLNQKSLRGILLAYPSRGEQEKIASVLGVITSKIDNESSKLKKLDLIKMGLMQEMLTGKVRVKVGEDEVASS
jgi:type I restriction enzyme, S subunit